MRHQRKPAKVRVGKASTPVPDIPLQEPILITDVGETLFRPSVPRGGIEWPAQAACGVTVTKFPPGVLCCSGPRACSTVRVRV